MDKQLQFRQAGRQDVPLDNPVARGQKQQHFLQNAVNKSGIPCPVDVVTVFTNPRVSFPSGLPTYVYTQDRFFSYLKENTLLKQGSINTREVSLKLADMAGNKKKK